MNYIIYRTGLNTSFCIIREWGCKAESGMNKTAGGLFNLFHFNSTHLHPFSYWADYKCATIGTYLLKLCPLELLLAKVLLVLPCTEYGKQSKCHS